MKRLALCIVIVSSVALGSCSRIERFPENARLFGDYWLSCKGVKKGMYHCKVYGRDSKELIREQTFIWPAYYGALDLPDLTKRITRYDGDTIYLEGKRKLIACDIPEDAALTQSINGGVWIASSGDGGKGRVFACTIYGVKDGRILSSGTYVLKRFSWEQKSGKMTYSEAKAPSRYLDFVYYGGVGISLGNKMVLMPDGSIDYPDGKGGGLRVSYDNEGNAVREEEY